MHSLIGLAAGPCCWRALRWLSWSACQVLADAGMVRDVKRGRERLWQLNPAQIEEAKRTLEVIGKQWEVALGRLKTFAEFV